MAVWLTMRLSQGTPNETARTNTVTATVTVHYNGGSYNGNSPSGTVTINGQSSSFSCNFNYAGIGQGAATTGTGSVVAATRTVTVPYGSSTTKTVYASASFNSGTASGTVSTSGSISLTPISAGGSSGGGGDDGGEEWDPDNPGGSGGITGNVGNCTIIGGTLFYSEKESLNYYLNTTFTVTSDDYIPYTYVLKFTTPSDVGYSHSLAVNLSGAKSYVYDEGDYRICYALCESDENHNMYLRATSIVNDPTQLASGSLSNREWFSMPFTIETNELQSNKEYYLIFWIPSDTGFVATAGADPTEYHGVTLNYIPSKEEEYRYLWIKHEEGLTVTLHRYDSGGDAYIDISDDSTDGLKDGNLWHVFIMRSGDYFRFSLEALPGYTLGEITTIGVQYNENRLDWSFDPNITDNAYVTATVTNDNTGSTYTEPTILWILADEGTTITVNRVYTTSNSEERGSYIGELTEPDVTDEDDYGIWYGFKVWYDEKFKITANALAGYTIDMYELDPDFVFGGYTGYAFNFETGHLHYYPNTDEWDLYTSSLDVEPWIYASANKNIPKGVFYIDNGIEYTAYQCYIDNGTSWDLVGGSPSGGGHIEFSGTVTTNKYETAASVNCGFSPDLVVLHLSEMYEEYHLSCAASFDVHNGAVNTAVWSYQEDGWIDMYIHREDQGFYVYAYDPDDNAIALTFNYVAIKYT